MFANFTEETCTGTAATLALAGATADHIAFSESFEDGDLVSYTLEDSGGVIKVAGIGTYVAATDDITRNDSWNWNGTVVDKNPSSNLTLSGGTHTVRCDIALSKAFASNCFKDKSRGSFIYPADFGNIANARSMGANVMTLVPARLLEETVINNLVFKLQTADGASTHLRIGIYSADIDGLPHKLIYGTPEMDGTTTAEQSDVLSTAIKLPAGNYFFAGVTDSTVLRFYGVYTLTYFGGGSIAFTGASSRNKFLTQSGVTGALPATAAVDGDTLNGAAFGWT